MQNYSSAKLEVLALKWPVAEKFCNYLLGSKFLVYTDNIPLVYIETNKLSALQIIWLSKLMLYDFTIKYRKGSPTWPLVPSAGICLTQSHHQRVTQ